MDSLVIMAACIIGFVWTAIFAKFYHTITRIKRLDLTTARKRRPAAISVVMPARNEADDIHDTLNSVLNQKNVTLEVIVVNDHSTDRTGEIVDDISRNDSRVQVIHNPELKRNWLGKCNAMQHGLSQAKGEYVIFSDGDVIHAPGCFISALAEFEENGYDLLSLFPLLDVRPFWENVIVPMYVFGLAKLVAGSKIEDPASPHAAATGAFILTKREILDKLGGFEFISTEMADDIALARMYKKNGYRIGYRFAPDCMTIRLFKNNIDAFWGTTKNVLLAVEGRPWLGIPLVVLSVLLFWVPFLCMGIGAATQHPVYIYPGAAIYIFQYATLFFSRGLFRFRPLKLLFFPLVVIVAGCCITRALFFYTRGSIWWKGREISVDGRNRDS